MLRTFFSCLGVLFAALIVFCASFLGNVAADIDATGADYEKLAVEVTRELSRTWTLADIEQHYAVGGARGACAGAAAGGARSTASSRLACCSTPTT